MKIFKQMLKGAGILLGAAVAVFVVMFVFVVCEDPSTPEQKAAEEAAEAEAKAKEEALQNFDWSPYPLMEKKPFVDDEFKSPAGYKRIKAGVGIIRAYGFTCDSVSKFTYLPWSGKYKVRCNFDRYSYELVDRGGTMIACLKKCK